MGEGGVRVEGEGRFTGSRVNRFHRRASMSQSPSSGDQGLSRRIDAPGQERAEHPHRVRWHLLGQHSPELAPREVANGGVRWLTEA